MENLMQSASTILNNYLATWEDFSIGWDLRRTADRLPEIPALARAYKFRRELLTAGPALLHYNEFSVPEDMATDPETKLFCEIYDKMASIPVLLTAWTRSSRRVFALTPEMQHAFSHISVADVPLRDICFPFDSFLIELAHPVTFGEGHSSGHLLVSKLISGDPANPDFAHGIELLNQNILDYRPLGAERHKEAQWIRERKSVGKIEKFLQRHIGRRVAKLYQYRSPLIAFKSDSEYAAPKLITQKSLTPSEATMVKIVLNLCLYLEALSAPEHTEHSDRQWQKSGPRNRTEFIADELEVCTIKGFHTLRTLSEGGHKSSRGAYEISEPHWRRGHKRRRPGEGSIPDAPRSVKVLPTLVRADLIPEYGLPVGAVTRIA